MAIEPGRRPRTAHRRTVRWRFAALYTGLFLVSGAALLAVVALVAGGSMVAVHAGADQPGPGATAPADAQATIAALQHRLVRLRSAQTHQLLLGSAVGLAATGLLSVGLGWYAAGRVLRPLRAMTVATRRISADNLHERLAVPGPHDELKGLGDTIDQLLERLEGAFAAQRRFVADASHELRTPLATMRAALDVALAKPDGAHPQTAALAGRVRTELDQADRLLEGLLVLARAQHGALPETARVRLEALAAAALDQRADAVAAKGLTVEAAATGSAAWVHGSRTLLRGLVANVVDNAILHNQPGGWIRITTHADGTEVRLVVENGGRLLDQDQVAQLDRPFRRLGAERTSVGSQGGSGLGLTIVAAVAQAHRGTLALHARPGGGLRATVTLPRAGEEAA